MIPAQNQFSPNSAASCLRNRFLGLVMVVACLAGPWLSAAEPVFKLYLDIKGIAGDVTDPGFENQIEVVSYSLSAPNPGDGGFGHSEAGEMSLLKYIDSSSPTLFSIAVSGLQLKAATLRVVQTVNGAIASIMIIDLRDVVITSVQNQSVTEAITLGFERSKVTFKKGSGKVP